MDPFGFEEEESEPNARQLRQTRAKSTRSGAKKSTGTRSKPTHQYNSSSGNDIRAKTLRSKAALAKKAGKSNPHGPTSSPAASASASVLTSTPIGRESGSRRASRTSRTSSRTRSAVSTSTPASSSARPSPAFDASHIPVEKENVRRRRGSRSQSRMSMSMSFLRSPRLTEPNVSAVLSSSMDCIDTSPSSCCSTSVARNRTPAKPDRKENETTRRIIKSSGKCNPTQSSRRRLQSNLDFDDEEQRIKKRSSISATNSDSEELEKLRAQFSDIDNFSLEEEVL